VVVPAGPDRSGPVSEQRAVNGRILLVSPPDSYRISPYVRAARSLGVEVMLASQGEWTLASPDAKGINVNLDDPDAALAILRDYLTVNPVDAVLGTDDGSLLLASRLAASLDLAHNPPEAVNAARRKDLSRRCLRRAGLPVPEHSVIAMPITGDPEPPACGYPCVVKPVAMAGSRGVIRADDAVSYRLALERTGRIIATEADHYERCHILVEAFIEGGEYALEGMLTAGRLEVLALFDKPDPLDGPFFEETCYVMPSRLAPELQRAIAETVERACRAHGLVRGPVHAECRVNDDGVWLIELAARTIGGLCSRLLTFGTGYRLEELVVANAIGTTLEHSRSANAVGVMMMPIREGGILRRVEGVLQAERVPGIDEISITVREGYRIVPLPDGASYLGFIFASAPTAAAVVTALREAWSCLNVVVAPYWPVGGAPHKKTARDHLAVS